jgi:hypothetical protein
MSVQVYQPACVALERGDSSGHAAEHAAMGVGIVQASPRRLKQFIDLANVTITPHTVTVASSIDQSSPFGGPALKLVITPSATGYVDVDLPANIPSFDGHLATSIYIDEPNRIASLTGFLSDSGFANYTSWANACFASGDMIGGPRVFWWGPMSGGTKATGGAGFTAGTTALQVARLRITAYAGADTTVWLRDLFIPAKQKPIICFTWDDGYDTWMTRVLPHLKAANVRGTFGVASSRIGAGGGITTADIATLMAGGHQLSVHNVNNYRVQTLASNGNGEQNGTGTSVDSAGYITEYLTCRSALEADGVDPMDLCFHPWVQGGSDHQVMELMRGCGVEIARTTSPYNPQPYGFPFGNNVMQLSAYPLRIPAAALYTLTDLKAQVDLCVKYGGILIFMGHMTADTAADSLTIDETSLTALINYAAASGADCLTMRQLRDRLATFRNLDMPQVNPSPATRMIGRLLAANFNSTSDQAIALPTGSWIIEQVYATKGSVSMTTAAGGVYTAGSKGGTAIVAAGQVYTGLTGTATDVVTATMAATPTVTSSIYFALTTPQGAAATGDVFVFGRPA